MFSALSQSYAQSGITTVISVVSEATVRLPWAHLIRVHKLSVPSLIRMESISSVRWDISKRSRSVLEAHDRDNFRFLKTFKTQGSSLLSLLFLLQFQKSSSLSSGFFTRCLSLLNLNLHINSILVTPHEVGCCCSRLNVFYCLRRRPSSSFFALFRLFFGNFLRLVSILQ